MGRSRIKRPSKSDRPAVKKRGLQTSLQGEIHQEIERLIGTDSGRKIDFEALETATRDSVLRLAAVLLEQKINADHSDYSGPRRSCVCGGDSRYVDRRGKTFKTVLGPVRLDRAYYHCDNCGQKDIPRDIVFGIGGGHLSPGVLRMVGNVGAMVSFEEGSSLLKQLAGLTIETKQVQRSAEALGAEIAIDEKTDTMPMDKSALPAALYLGVDGTGVPIRAKELNGCCGKQPDGSAKTREVKLCVIWSAEGRDEDGIAVRDPGSVTYSAAIESAAAPENSASRSEFNKRVLRETTRRRFCQAARTVVIGDGAPWIWNSAQELFPNAIQIVDRFHVKQNLSDVAKVLHSNSSEATAWAKLRHDELDAGTLSAILESLRRHIHTCEEARKCYHYIRRNRHRMRYPRFLKMGLCTSSGVVEAGCKVTVATRLKRAGMHWTVDGANQIIALRCCILSGRFEDFWERRSSLPIAA